MTCSFLFLTGKMSISSVFVTMLAFNLAVFPCPLFHKLKAQGAKKTADCEKEFALKGKKHVTVTQSAVLKRFFKV